NQTNDGDEPQADAGNQHRRAALLLAALLLALPLAIRLGVHIPALGLGLRLGRLDGVAGLRLGAIGLGLDAGLAAVLVVAREVARVLNHEAILALGAIDLLAHQAGILDGDHGLATGTLLLELCLGSHRSSPRTIRRADSGLASRFNGSSYGSARGECKANFTNSPHHGLSCRWPPRTVC